MVAWQSRAWGQDDENKADSYANLNTVMNTKVEDYSDLMANEVGTLMDCCKDWSCCCDKLPPTAAKDKPSWLTCCCCWGEGGSCCCCCCWLPPFDLLDNCWWARWRPFAATDCTASQFSWDNCGEMAEEAWSDVGTWINWIAGPRNDNGCEPWLAWAELLALSFFEELRLPGFVWTKWCRANSESFSIRPT